MSVFAQQGGEGAAGVASTDDDNLGMGVHGFTLDFLGRWLPSRMLDEDRPLRC
ncbi:hypothetical protein FQZ97_890110 [compost metagenome]